MTKCVFLENTKPNFQKALTDYNVYKMKQELLDEFFFEKKLNSAYEFVYEFFTIETSGFHKQIVRQGQPFNRIYFIYSGQVKLFQLVQEQKEKSVLLNTQAKQSIKELFCISKGFLLGLWEYINKTTTYQCSTQVVSNKVEVLSISKENFKYLYQVRILQNFLNMKEQHVRTSFDYQAQNNNRLIQV